MPYIPKADRFSAATMPQSAGQLNFAITRVITEYLGRKGINYGSLNEVIGVLECAKLEAYRRLAAPYEDQKRDQNGDVYP